MASKIEVNLKGIERQIKTLKNIPMDKIGARALELNFDQIEKRQNADGTRFKNYSQQYAERKGVGVGAVDLTSKASASSNRGPIATMLKSFGVLKTTGTSVILGFRGAWDKQKAAFNVTGGKSKDRARPFVGLTKGNEKKLMKFVYKKVLEK